MFDSQGNNKDGGWAPMGEKRGGKDYYPPYGWIGHGLNVLGRYDGGDDTWIGMKNKKGEWCVAYHGTGMNCVKAILETKFKPGGGQVHANDHDLNHPGQIVGVGVYCSPKMTEVEGVYDNKDGGEGAHTFFRTLNDIGLSDTYLAHYDTKNYVPGEPLTMSHLIQLGDQKRRYDFVFAKDTLQIADSEYHYKDSVKAGSDHALNVVTIDE